MSARQIFRQRWFADVLALGVLSAVAWAIAGFMVRDDVFIYGDHPGHYFTLWYSLNVAVPEHHRLIDWMPHWYAGYPELLFYPPGWVIAGWGLNLLTLGKLSTASIYQSIVFIAFALPAFTFYFAVRHLKFELRAAIAAGLFALGFPAFFDGAQAVVIGMLGSRLAFGLNALVLVWAIEFIESRRWRLGGLAAGALALVILLHPYHAIGVMLALGIYALVRGLALVPAGLRLVGLALFALSLDAFWLVPLARYSSVATIPLIRSTLDQTWHLLVDAVLLPYVLVALAAVARVRRDQNSVRRSLVIVLIILPILLGTIVLTVHSLVIERWQVYQLDPVRLIGEFYFAIIILAAIGLSDLGGWIAQSFLPLHLRSPVAIGLTILASVVLALPFVQTVAYFSATNTEPCFLRQAIVDYRLDELWTTLQETPGRILYTSYFTQLNARGVESLPTTITALTPLYTNRQIMGGTFGRWSPVAALMWTGQINPPTLRGLPEEQDDRALFGVPIEKISDAQLFEYCRRFNITTIVASVNDFHTRTFLDASPRFQSYYNNDYFFAYRVNAYENAWIEAQNASVDLLSFDDTEIVLRVRAAQPNASVDVKIFAYPLWRARTDTGQVLSIQRDDLALMRIALPPGENYTITLRYEEGVVEQIGALISIVAGTIFVGSGLIGFWSRVR